MRVGGCDPQGAWRQDKLIGSQLPVGEVTIFVGSSQPSVESSAAAT
jgi:hypothetical protein